MGHLVQCTSLTGCPLLLGKIRQPPGNGPVRWADLRELPFVLYTSDFMLHQTVLERCASAGFTPQVQLQTRYWDFIGDLVAANVGVAVMIEHVAAKYDPKHIASRPLVDPVTCWEVGLTWRQGYLSRAAHAWLECVQAVYPDQASGTEK